MLVPQKLPTIIFEMVENANRKNGDGWLAEFPAIIRKLQG
jgi:hypothetical protein